MTSLPADISIPASVVLTSDASNRDAQRLLAIVGQFALDLDDKHPRYGRRDITGDEHPETFCNVFLRDFAAAMGAPIHGALANHQVMWLASDEARKRGWATVSEHAAHGCAEEGMVVVVGWYNRNGGPGHVAVVVPSLGEPGTWIAQAGKHCFSRGLLRAGFGDLPVTFFVHP